MARVSRKSDEDGRLLKLGEAIRAMRKAAGFSQEALADAAKIDRAHMGLIERGQSNVTMLILLQIADAIGCPASEILSKAGL